MVKRYVSSNKFGERILIAIGILGFIGALFSLSPNMTGNTIGTLTNDSSNLLGISLLGIGIASIWAARIKD